MNTMEHGIAYPLQNWLAISKYCIDLLNHENLTAEILDVYTDASGPYLDDGEEAEDFDVEQPRACSVPAQEESAADELAAVIKLMFFNDSVGTYSAKNTQ